MLSDLVKGNADVLLIHEKKLETSFLDDGQFQIPGFTVRFHRERYNDGVIMVFIREETPLILLSIGDAPGEGHSTEIVIVRRNDYS